MSRKTEEKELQKEEVSPPVEMTVREAGRKGGKMVSNKYGPEFYEEIGRMGGQSRKRILGKEGYRRLGKMGGERVRELIEQGKRAAAEETRE